MLQSKELAVYFIMGSNNVGEKEPLAVLKEALEGGITMFQFREKGAGATFGEQKRVLAGKMKELCDSYNVPFIVNDDVDLAIAVNAAGVHVGQDDESIQTVRARCPASYIVGVSATNISEAIQAANEGADYIGAGPVFATSTKEDAKTPIGLDGLTLMREQIGTTPMVAIGGITEKNAASVRKAGADGVSVISAISLATDPKQAVSHLRK
ncbi:thiamine-phosphate synthase [Paraliobacillus ryukyuensis]|uniref:Thiamine-phosphate synthase n=1 Tax=Paraliobacillus ryukyuensis TaxID=200904 RepID=A0A366ECI3_9BACI|nr:thiamine phosphate synthase [Paraliobacillus ryukyuensis]RBO99775.1 thiamine-phosphate diphosphorylase [Paraliobacillus ryukyuensis]